VGCATGPEVIAGRSGTIRTLAESSKARFADHGDPAGVSEQQQIIEAAHQISVTSAAIRERDSEWAPAIEWAAYATVAVVVLLLLWKLGIARLVRGAIHGAA